MQRYLDQVVPKLDDLVHQHPPLKWGIASLYACVNWFIYDICVYISEQEVLLIEEDRNGADRQDGDMSCSLIQKIQIIKPGSRCRLQLYYCTHVPFLFVSLY